ncbi:UNVERIFIED_CONTAM: hypothetical protein FKN15_035513 [Acipenser sinensis]
MWHCFLQEVPPVGVGQSAKCRTCSKFFGSCGSTKGLLTHLKTLHNIDSMKKRTEADAESKSSASASGQSSSSFLTVTPAASAANLAKKTNLIHSFQTKKDMLRARGFTELLTSETTIHNMVVDYSKNVRSAVMQEIIAVKKEGARFSLTFNEWTSIHECQRACVKEVNANGKTFTVKSTLELKVDRKDDGVTITCRVDHESLSSAPQLATQVLKVHYAPVVKIIPPPELPQEGHYLTLVCDFNGNPNPEPVIWTKDGGELPDPDRMTVNGRELTIAFLNKTDNGTYRCEVSNSIGQDNAEYVLFVYDFPTTLSPSTTTPPQTTTTTTTVSIETCAATSAATPSTTVKVTNVMSDFLIKLKDNFADRFQDFHVPKEVMMFARNPLTFSLEVFLHQLQSSYSHQLKKGHCSCNLRTFRHLLL